MFMAWVNAPPCSTGHPAAWPGRHRSGRGRREILDLFAERVGPCGRVIGLDADQAHTANDVLERTHLVDDRARKVQHLLDLGRVPDNLVGGRAADTSLWVLGVIAPPTEPVEWPDHAAHRRIKLR